MNTPICDFVKKYAESGKVKLHMPGHKGTSFLGLEKFDITEIDGADSLYEASGIIAQSEKNASELFSCKTFYSTEGSSQCIKAMVHLLSLDAKNRGKIPYIWAGRNAHKAFHSAIALLDIDVDWIYPSEMDSYLSCNIDADELSLMLKGAEKKPSAIYITSPDYLGNVADVEAIARVCKENDVLLAVDNAHGAYLKFLQSSKHPIDLGADICCDSAHKTLPVFTGGAYLHLSHSFGEKFNDKCVKDAMLLFGSTSPSYIILQSLDMANAYLENYALSLCGFAKKVKLVKNALTDNGYELYGGEVLKITVCAKNYGYEGYELKDILLQNGVVCEFCDRDFVVMMLTPEISDEDLKKLCDIMLSIPKRDAIKDKSPSFVALKKGMSLRDAMLSNSECIPLEKSLGRVVAISNIGCPPAVPIAVAGEIIDQNVIECLKYYKITEINVVK